MTTPYQRMPAGIKYHLDKAIQPIKDIREEITLRSKWQDLRPHLPSWTSLVDFKAYRNGCLLDVGCHYGLISIHYIQQTKQPAYGFDVNPQINRLLRKNLLHSPYSRAFIIQGFGLADYNGKAQSYNDTKYSGATTVNPEQVQVAKELIGIQLRKRNIVEVRRLDDVPIPHPIALIKIDCEGNEAHVIRGAAKTIQKQHPTIIFEALTIEKQHECERLLEGMGYRTRPLDQRNFIAEWKE
ncbi:MAG: FkbM family methyltransferase [Candidatus Iainarchaeum archaeon]|uniref:FkbM family methyltransferase n=1 Tax=Candidatus Iainarchaeum sp. TaxID=3101447 RepID=A0A7T9DK75_9ARCH|nr:MAG: FkbM family methyltransferase [Candidatus Diapherotrites archaeon]